MQVAGWIVGDQAMSLQSSFARKSCQNLRNSGTLNEKMGSLNEDVFPIENGDMPISSCFFNY